MKPQTLFLAASLAFNLVLASLFVIGRAHNKTGPQTSPLSALLVSQPSPGSADAAGNATGGTGTESNSTANNPTLIVRDPAALYQQLRDMGLTEEVARRIVRTMMFEPYYARYRALIAKHHSDKSDLLRDPNSSNGFTKEERAELRAISRDINHQIIAALGSTTTEPDLASQRYSFLPQDKADQLRQINRDYAEMRTDLNDEIGRFRVPSDDQKLKLLEQERRKDLEALFTPEELKAYDLRYSATASTLRNRLAKVDVSDSEFRSLFDLLKPIYDSASTASTGFRPNEPLTAEQLAQFSALRDARNNAEEQVRALLGDARYADYNKAGSSDYRNLQAAATRFDLAPQTVEQVFSLRNNVSAESLQIANNGGLTPEQKKAELANLANQTRAQVRASLGPEIGDAYLKTNMQWLDKVSSGHTITFSPTGNTYSTKPVVPRNPVRTPPPVQK